MADEDAERRAEDEAKRILSIVKGLDLEDVKKRIHDTKYYAGTRGRQISYEEAANRVLRRAQVSQSQQERQQTGGTLAKLAQTEERLRQEALQKTQQEKSGRLRNIWSRYQAYRAEKRQDRESNRRAEELMTPGQKEMSDKRARQYRKQQAVGLAGGMAKATGKAVSGTFGLMGGIAGGIAGGAKAAVSGGGTFFIVLALLITVLDGKWFKIKGYGIGWLSWTGIFGKQYQGFELDLIGLAKVDWLGILFGSALALIIVLRTLFKIFKSNESLFGWIIFLLIAAQLKKYLTELPLEISAYWSYVGIVFIVLVSFLIKWLRQEAQIISQEDVTFLVFAFVVSFFLRNVQWTDVPMAIIHFIFILVFGFFYMLPNEKDNMSKWYMLMTIFIVSDFLLIKSLEKTFFEYIPFMYLVTGSYVIFNEPNNTKAKIFVITPIFIALAAGFLSPSLPYFEGESPLKEAGTEEAKSVTEKFVDAVKQWYETKLEIASGGFYKGKVEENQYEKLGVYLDRVRSSEPRYYTEEPVTLWGTIKAKTLSDAVIVKFNCNKWTSDNKRVNASKIVPEKTFPIFNLEERDVECTFDATKGTDEEKNKQRFPAGTHTVTMTAEYNFATDAYLKSYYIDRDRYRAMIREELDPFKEFGITDKKPVAIFTNGPVEIGMDLTPLIPVERAFVPSPALSISLNNRGKVVGQKGEVLGEWEGRIKRIKELVVLLPKGVDMVDPNIIQKPEIVECDDKKFKEYTKISCQESCTEHVLNHCKEVCDGISDANEKQICQKECEDSKKKCDEDCNIFFEADEGTEYKGYSLMTEGLKYTDELKDVDRFRTFRCRLYPTKDVLGTTPITTRFIRVRTRYSYQLEKSVNVPVELAPGSMSVDITGIFLDESKGKDVPAILPLAIAYTESGQGPTVGFRHCCKEAGKNKAETCKFVADRYCERDRILESFAASDAGHYSIGVMQINEGNQKYTENCENKDLKDLQCNIKAGLEILKENYNNYKNGLPESYLDTCKKQNEGYYNRYKEYREWKAALRAYHGPACRNSNEGEYVERVINNACDIARGIIKLEHFPEEMVKNLNYEDLKKQISCP